jgi:hypothetical protein
VHPDRVTTPAFMWKSADLGAPRLDLEDKDALHRILDKRS